ncbi:hypothetical protein NPIL_113791 [Nephila pilipes]|uniref:Uncharacterized protein n=1 Tax=Nephila pilipes TaxID=299642 RepID=A0A8X6PHI8_NEPPI|nr:hypothetical protein NPIL_113791 [Nephila pilipes]
MTPQRKIGLHLHTTIDGHVSTESILRGMTGVLVYSGVVPEQSGTQWCPQMSNTTVCAMMIKVYGTAPLPLWSTSPPGSMALLFEVLTSTAPIHLSRVLKAP